MPLDMNLPTRIQQLVIAGLGIALLSPTVAAPSVAFAETANNGVQHEYRLIYNTKAGVREISIAQQPPPGVTFDDWQLVHDTWKKRPESPWAVLRRSDGVVVGAGKKGKVVAGRIRAASAGKPLRDFKVYDTKRWGLLFDDGTITGTFPEGNALPQVPVGVSKPVRLVAGGNFEPILLWSDGRITAYANVYSHEKMRFEFSPVIAAKHSDYVDAWGGFFNNGSTRSGCALLLRANGQVDTLNFYEYERNNYGQDGDPAHRRGWVPPILRVPSLPSGVGIVDASVWDWVAYLRSDGKIIYRGSTSPFKGRPQPPTPPTGMKYVGIDDLYDVIVLLRSDGQMVQLDRRDIDQRKKYPIEMPKLAKGWRFVSVQGSGYPVYLVEKIPAGEQVVSGIEKVTPPKTLVRGKKAVLKVRVASRAKLSGGIVQVTHKGKLIGKATVKGSTAMVRIKTKAFKRTGRNTIGVQYLGNAHAKVSVKAKARLTTSGRRR